MYGEWLTPRKPGPCQATSPKAEASKKGCNKEMDLRQQLARAIRNLDNFQNTEIIGRGSCPVHDACASMLSK